MFLLFSSSYADNFDVEFLKAVNAQNCKLYDFSKDFIATNIFAGAVGLSSVFVAPRISLVSAALTAMEVYLLKNILKRPRPFQRYAWVIQRAKAKGYSMPSGHAAMAFESAYIWSMNFPRLSPFFYLVATWISVSRIYYGVHYPSDVLVGAAIGYLTSYFVACMINLDNSKKKVSLNFGWSF